MIETARRRSSYREYLRLEEYSNVRHEFLEGLISYSPGSWDPRAVG